MHICATLVSATEVTCQNFDFHWSWKLPSVVMSGWSSLSSAGACSLQWCNGSYMIWYLKPCWRTLLPGLGCSLGEWSSSLVAGIADWPRSQIYVLWSGFSAVQVLDVCAGMPPSGKPLLLLSTRKADPGCCWKVPVWHRAIKGGAGILILRIEIHRALLWTCCYRCFYDQAEF